MPSIAIEVRPAIVGALLLTLGLAVGLECAPRSPGSKMSPGKLGACGGTIRIDSITGGCIRTTATVRPRHSDHADARPWPHGMVIAPPPTHDAIQAALTGPIAGPASPIARSIERLVNTLIATLVPQSS